MTAVIDSEAHNFAMQVVKCTLTFASATQSVQTTHSYYGFVTQCFINHGGTAPDTAWDLTVTDENLADSLGVDLLNGKGQNIVSATDTFTYTQADLDNGMACAGKLTFAGAQGGNSSGVAEIILYIARYQ